jgi:hypothetical protein
MFAATATACAADYPLVPVLKTDAYTPGVAAALEALARFRLVAGLLPPLRYGELRDPAQLRAVVDAINACLDAVCAEPGSALASSRNSAAAARLLLRDHFTTEQQAALN